MSNFETLNNLKAYNIRIYLLLRLDLERDLPPFFREERLLLLRVRGAVFICPRQMAQSPAPLDVEGAASSSFNSVPE